MGRFKRVSENEEIPQSIDRALFKTASIQEDPYAKLVADAQNRRASINRESLGYNDEIQAAQEKAWERLSSASKYNYNNFTAEDDVLSNLNPEDISMSGIRRAGYDTDNISMAMRPNPTDMFNDPITVAMRGASMWGDHDEIEDILLSMAEEDNQKFDRISEREKKSARVASWENEKLEELGSLRNQAFATNRGHSIVRAHHEGGVAGKNNMLDYSFLDEREQQRLAMVENKRAQKLAIKEVGERTRQDIHSDWEKSALENVRAPRVQDYKSDWADELDRIIGKG